MTPNAKVHPSPRHSEAEEWRSGATSCQVALAPNQVSTATSNSAIQPGCCPLVPISTSEEPARFAKTTALTISALGEPSGAIARRSRMPAKAQPNTEAKCQVAQIIRTCRSRSGGAAIVGTSPLLRRCRKMSISPSTEWPTPVKRAITPAAINIVCINSSENVVCHLTCPVPCDHIPVRSWPLFRAPLLRRASRKRCRSAHSGLAIGTKCVLWRRVCFGIRAGIGQMHH